MALTRFTRNAIKVLKLIVDEVQNLLANRFLWFNKLVRYQNKPLLIEILCNAGMFNHHPLLNLENEMYSYDETAAKFELNPNNFSFIKHITLVAAIPPSWLNEDSDHNQNHSYYFSSILGKSNKIAYIFLKNKLHNLHFSNNCNSVMI